jgi:hypothetical protein
MSYTPINICKLKGKAKEFLKECDRMERFAVSKIHVPPDIFSYLLDAISAGSRSYYSDAIPYRGKMLVRK